MLTTYQWCNFRADVYNLYGWTTSTDWWLYYHWGELLDASSIVTRPTEAQAVINIMEEIHERRYN